MADYSIKWLVRDLPGIILRELLGGSFIKTHTCLGLGLGRRVHTLICGGGYSDKVPAPSTLPDPP